MAIFVYTGKPRHGKTLELARIAYKLLRKKERVFSNLKLNLGKGVLKHAPLDIEGDFTKEEDRNNPKKLLFYWRNLHQWEHMKDGNIICDELTRYFNPRLWGQLSEETEIKLQQHGKESLNIYGTTQHYTRIDVTLRLLVEKFYIVKTIFGKATNKRPLLFKVFKIWEIDLEDIDDFYYAQKHPDQEIKIDVKSHLRLFRKKYAVIYDTFQMVGHSEAMPLVHKVRVCGICGRNEIRHV